MSCRLVDRWSAFDDDVVMPLGEQANEILRSINDYAKQIENLAAEQTQVRQEKMVSVQFS